MSRSSAKPTERQLYILDYAERTLLVVRPSEMFSTWQFIRNADYAPTSTDRNPSEREGRALLVAGWIRFEVWPGNYTTNTRTGKRTDHYKAVLTHEGFVVLKESRA